MVIINLINVTVKYLLIMICGTNLKCCGNNKTLMGKNSPTYVYYCTYLGIHTWNCLM